MAENEDPVEERFGEKVILRNIVIAFVLIVYFYIFLKTLFDV